MHFPENYSFPKTSPQNTLFNSLTANWQIAGLSSVSTKRLDLSASRGENNLHLSDRAIDEHKLTTACCSSKERGCTIRLDDKLSKSESLWEGQSGNLVECFKFASLIILQYFKMLRNLYVYVYIYTYITRFKNTWIISVSLSSTVKKSQQRLLVTLLYSEICRPFANRQLEIEISFW